MNCPLCKSTVLYVGLNSIECKGRKCQNFKGQAITKLTREYLNEFFAKVSLKTGKPWSLKDLPELGSKNEHLEYVELTGLSEYPLVFLVGEFGSEFVAFEEWVTLFDKTWASCL